MIWNNYKKGEPWNLIKKKFITLIIWNVLKAQYKGKRYVLEYNIL